MNVLLNGSSVSPAKAASITTLPGDSTRKAAFAILEQARKANPALAEIKQFEPYVLRHIALTRLAEAGAGVCGVAKIAGHSTILITQSYVHEGADAIQRAFHPNAKRSNGPWHYPMCPILVRTKLVTA